MTPTEHSAKTPSTRTGIFALRSNLLGVKGTGAGGRALIIQGTGARKAGRARLLTLALLATLLSTLVLNAAPALAEAVEKPEALSPVPLYAAQATLRGVLDPGKTGKAGTFEMGTYEFVYLQSATACEGVGAHRTAEGLSLGEGQQEVSQAVEDLAPNTEYSVCLIARSETEEVLSAKLTFKTAVAVAPEAPSTEPPIEVRGDTATVDGVVNPNITEAVEPGTYEFLYKATANATQAECESAGASSAPAPPDGYAGAGPEPFSEVISGLTQDTEYVVCLAASDAGGRTVGPAVAFTTGTPEAPETGAVESITGTTATFRGVLNPRHAGEAGTYEFLYNEGGGCEGGSAAPTPAGAATGASPEPVSASVSKLLPGTEYTVCLSATNAAEEAATGAPVMFTTTAVGPEDSPTVTATEARVTAEIGTDNAETTYEVQYGTSGVEESTTPQASVPAASAPVDVQQVLTGLKAATTYHFRFVANDGHGSVDGEERTFTTPAAAIPASETCPNAQLRAEQPYGLALPDCRAYEMVSPVATAGQAAADAEFSGRARAAALSKKEETPALTYISTGSFAGPAGATLYSQYLSRREAGGWTTRAITPPQETKTNTVEGPFETAVFNPGLTEGIAGTRAALPGTGSPTVLAGKRFALYHDDFAGESPFRYVSESFWPYPWGASEELSDVVFGEGGGPGGGGVSEWVEGEGTVDLVGVANDGASVSASVGTAPFARTFSDLKDAWRAVSSDGSRVYFTSPGLEHPEDIDIDEPPGQLFVRVNADVPPREAESKEPEANGTGSLTQGSETVSALVAASGRATFTEGSTEATLGAVTAGRFVVGDPVTASGIPAETKITAIEGATRAKLTLSAAYTGRSEAEQPISSDGPEPFAVGEKITGDGIPAGTTITAVGPTGTGTLTLSNPAASSGSEVELHAGGGCTLASNPCTIDVSASQRLKANPAGRRLARYWGASADGSRAFFTSTAELTEDAYTGADGEAANLYEYDLERPVGERLKDLTVDEEGDGAAVQGVAQISQESSYVYFVASGALKGAEGKHLENARGEEPEAGGDNLYVSHEGGEPAFIATLAPGDKSDWEAGQPSGDEAGPALNTAVVNEAGTDLAFISERSLTGYDNEQAAPEECEAHHQRGVQFTEAGACREVFLYDAEAGASGSLVCASCDPSGARPRGPAGFGEAAEFAGSYRPRNVSEGGAVFFDSSDALAGASGGVQNVYEYEDGGVHAISSVAGGDESFFLDASVSGSDVFFATANRLLPQDPGEDVVVYDARVDGGFPVPASPVSCEGEGSCRASQTPQPGVFGTPASATFSGPGNLAPAPPVPAPKPKPLTRAQKLAAALKACRRDRSKKKRAACEASARRRYGTAKKHRIAKKPAKMSVARRVGNDRRLGR